MHQVIQPSDVCALFYVDLAHKQVILLLFTFLFSSCLYKNTDAQDVFNGYDGDERFNREDRVAFASDETR